MNEIRIKKHETRIIGRASRIDGKIEFDSDAMRVEKLIRDYLILINKDLYNWTELYQDPTDHRYWEAHYLQSSLHGGGPRSLFYITDDFAKSNYDISKNIIK